MAGVGAARESKGGVLDFEDDETWLSKVNRKHVVKLDTKIGNLRFNWVSSLLASVILWGMVIYCLSDDDCDDGECAKNDLAEGQAWVTQNFTWLYIGTQDVWIVFLIWLCFSKYGNIKLGRDDEPPLFSDTVWFMLLFTCGLGIGLFYWGVSEPIYYYRGYAAMQKPGYVNEDQRAQQAIFITLFHWGLHGWIPYILCAVNMGVVCFRNGYPLSMRYCFQPLLGDAVTNGVLGDLIDAVSIACTTFGVCTSLGMGAASIAEGIERLNKDVLDPSNTSHLCWIIALITFAAMCSVLTGLNRGIKYLASFTFMLANFFMFVCMFSDNTWYLLNVVVQSVGHYFQWIIQVGFDCEAFQQLNYEIDPTQYKGNLLLGSQNHDSPANLLETLSEAPANFELFNTTALNNSPEAFFGESVTNFMDWWTIFYWGWWISWAPFVGTFVAKISRGRTVRNVILGAFILPCLYSFIWFAVYGGLGIKMQRVAEVALTPSSPETLSPWYDADLGAIHGAAAGGKYIPPSCATMGYEGSTPVRADAIALADLGYFPLSCRSHAGRIYDIVAPYLGIETFLVFTILVAVILYFVSSSDSGSYVDTLTSAQGHEKPAAIQEIYWSWTEGISAIALLKAGGGDALTALRSISLIAGLPFTIALCYMCTSTLMACKIAMNDPDIVHGQPWTSSIVDIFVGFEGYDPAERIKELCVAMVAPAIPLGKVAAKVYDSPNAGIVVGMSLFVLYWTALLVIFIGHGMENDEAGFKFGWSIGWALYVCYALCIGALRTEVRNKYGIYGNLVEDIGAGLFWSPGVVAQMGRMAEDNPTGPISNADVDVIIGQGTELTTK